VKVTTPDEIAQMLDDPDAIVMATLNPDDAVAVGVYVPLTTGVLGEGEVRLMLCITRVVVKLMLVDVTDA
jgi:hypothetical protein